METDINETGNIGTKGETRGSRDKWRHVGDMMEMGWTWNRKGIAEDDRVEQTLLEIH